MAGLDMKECAFIGGLAVMTGLLALASGICWVVRLVIGAFTWVAYGEWPTYSVFELLRDISLSPPQTALLGIQKTINWTMEQSATVAFFVFAMGFFFVAGILVNAADECVKEKRRAAQREEHRRKHPEPEYTLEDLIKGKEPPKSYFDQHD